MKPKTITQNTCGRTDVFRVFETFPKGYVVWNIGRRNFPYKGYVPIAKPGTLPYHIDLGHLGALKMESEKAALRLIEAAHHCDAVTSNNYRQFLQ